MSTPAPTPWSVVARTAIAPAIWGTTYIVTTELLPEGRPMFVGMFRAIPAGLLLLAIAPTRSISIGWKKLVVLAVLNIGLFSTLMLIGAYRLPGGVAGTVSAFQPLFVVGLSAAVLGTAVSGRSLIAGVAGVIGVALLVLRGDAAMDTWGVVTSIGSVASSSCGVVLIKRWASDVAPMTLAGWQLLLGGLMLAPVALMTEGVPSELTGRNLGGLAFMAIANGAISYSLWFSGIRRLAVTQTSFLILVVPLVSTAIGWLVLDETLTPPQILGAVIVLAAAVSAQRPVSVSEGSVQPSREPDPAR